MSEKRCPRCSEEKPESEFTEKARSSDSVSGLSSYCAACRREVNAIQYGNRRRGGRLEDAFEPRF
jgi:hypothetical protein